MHIPSEMLTGPICPITAAIAATGIGGAAVSMFGKKSAVRSAAKFALVAALVFGLQMLNYPIWNGVSAHLIGGVLAASLLGTAGGVLAVALVLTVQTLMFADGGILMLGANIFNMAVIGAGFGGWLRSHLIKRGASASLATGIAAAASVEAAAAATGLELAIGCADSSAALGTLLGVHAAVAVVEGVATALLVKVCAFEETGADVAAESKRPYAVVAGLILACVLAAHFASPFPDAFEWTMEKFSMLPDAPNFAHAPIPDYEIASVSSDYLKVAFAAIAGIATVIAAGFALVAAPLAVRRK
jgi:ABC-type Co2+ transport system, permease component